MYTRNMLARTLRNAALGTALMALLPVAAMAQNSALPEKIKAAKALVVGIEATYPPMAYKDPKTNQRTGVNVDLVESIAKEL
jgi:polar amino acid transport system substrate-binding protein